MFLLQTPVLIKKKTIFNTKNIFLVFTNYKCGGTVCSVGETLGGGPAGPPSLASSPHPSSLHLFISPPLQLSISPPLHLPKNLSISSSPQKPPHLFISPKISPFPQESLHLPYRSPQQSPQQNLGDPQEKSEEKSMEK